jgi:hypothetical protein
VDIDSAVSFGDLGNHELDMDVGVLKVPFGDDVIDMAVALGGHKSLIVSFPIDDLPSHAKELMLFGIQQQNCTFGRWSGDRGLIWSKHFRVLSNAIYRRNKA